MAARKSEEKLKEAAVATGAGSADRVDYCFETDLERLEKIVGALEEGGLSLDDSLKQFELGIKLARRCEKTLSEAEKRIEILTKKANGELVAEPFDDGAEAPVVADNKAKAPKTRIEETVIAEKSVEIVAEKRRVEITEDGDEDEADDEENGTLLF